MFIFNAKTYKDIKPSLFMISGVALLVSILIGLLLSTNAMAKMTTDTAPSARAASYSYWKATSRCVTSHMRATIQTEVGANGDTKPGQSGSGNSNGSDEGEWFDDVDAWVTVYPNNKQDCDQVMVNALKLWGWTDYKTFLKDIGYTFDSDIPAWVQGNKSTDGNKRFDGFKSAVLSKVGNVVDLLDNSAKYALYMGIFSSKDKNLSDCSAKQIGKLSAVDATQREAANKNQFRDGVTYTVIKVVEDSAVVDYVYTYAASRQSTGDDTSGNNLLSYASTWNYRGANYPGSDGEHFSCKELVSKINSSAPSFLLWNKQHNDTPDSVANTGSGDANCTVTDTCDPVSTCNIEGVGWIVCPVLVFMGGIVDGAYNFVSGLLVVKALVTTGENEGVYLAWAVMRNVANIAFVIAFLIVIFSQLTGVGVSNYGVKKLLPRLVVAAILVNISFWVCAIAVDLSNIIGASVIQVFDSVEVKISDSLSGGFNTGDKLLNGGQWTDMVGAALVVTAAGTALYYVTLSALVPALLAAVVAIVTVFLVLTLRQALIILLIVVSPLAFVAYLLPNTEDLFTKWRKLFMTLLLMYPIIAGIFGASALASMIVMHGAEGNTVVQIMGACIAILPLAITPLVMKTAGGVLNRFGGIVNNANKGPVDRLKRSSEKYREGRTNLRNAQALNGAKQLGRGSFVRWRARRDAISGGRQSEAGRANTEYLADQAQTNSGFRNAAAGGTLTSPPSDSATQRVLSNAINTQTKLEIEEVNAAKSVIEHANLSGSQRQELALNGSVTVDVKDAQGKVTGQNTYSSPIMQKAAIQEQFRTGSIKDMHAIVANSGSTLKDFKLTIAQSVASSGVISKNPALGGKTIDDISQGKITSQADLDVRVLASIKEGKFNAENLAGMHDEARQMAINAAVNANDSVAKGALVDAATKLATSPELMDKIAGNKRAADQLDIISRL
ncbi:MAG: hypothetical protein JWO54_161 [Candidatus Saccharibacteria bacterium]|nr:hypothetical protein [Candidatus Saccharibacteria bacterium]